MLFFLLVYCYFEITQFNESVIQSVIGLHLPADIKRDKRYAAICEMRVCALQGEINLVDVVE